MFANIVNCLLFQVSDHLPPRKSYVLVVIRTAVPPDVIRPGIGT